MNDDIVTRLRLWATVEGGDSQITDELHNAADEIERLREQLWKYQNCEMICESYCEPDWDDGECDTCARHRNEAVNGE